MAFQVEAVDAAPQFLVMHSLAGGTGAGAGSALLQALRQEYPLNTLATASVVPRLEGAAGVVRLHRRCLPRLCFQSIVPVL